MALGLGVLRLSPAEFWNLTPRELAMASRGFPDLRTLQAPDRPRAKFWPAS